MGQIIISRFDTCARIQVATESDSCRLKLSRAASVWRQKSLWSWEG